MTLEQILDSIPDYAGDLKLNLSTLLRQSELTAQQIWGTTLASAMASRNSGLLAAISEEAAKNLTPEALNAAKAAAAIMGMNNIYFRFLHLPANQKYRAIPAGLRMNVTRSPGAPRIDFELWCLAVSAINGCGACVDSHEKLLREKGMSEEAIAAAVRIASVVHALAVVLESETPPITTPSAA